MTKSKKMTNKEIKEVLAKIDSGLIGLSNILKMYMEYKGDLIMFNNHLAEKQREQESKIRAEQYETKEDDGNTD